MKIYHYFKNLGEQNTRTKRLYQALFWGSIVAISVLAFLKGAALPPLPNVGDKFKHIFAFIYLTIAADLAYSHLCIRFRVVTLILFGAFIEVFQLYLPWRIFELLDLTVDTAAILLISIFLSVNSKNGCASPGSCE